MRVLVAAFPVWVLVASAIALAYPPSFTWFRGPLITIALGLIMLGMGLTLVPADFQRVARTPRDALLGVALQFGVMPLLGLGVGWLFALPRPFAVGLILVSCCPGGTASNVVAFLAKANVALSVTMTALSTLAAVLLTPILTTLLVGNRVPVDPLGLLWSTVQVVLLPVGLGLLLRHRFPRFVHHVLPIAPLAAVILITLIVASIIGAGQRSILDAGLPLIGAVILLHTLGFGLGFALSRRWVDAAAARTIAIEVGMQNSGLGVVLARQNFADPLVAIPSAISSLVHSLLGSALAGLWRRC